MLPLNHFSSPFSPRIFSTSLSIRRPIHYQKSALLFLPLSLHCKDFQTFSMSWMDSWSRPSKRSAVPPPLYLTSGTSPPPYCHACGRVMPARKSKTQPSTSQTTTPVKYCSDRCRRNKPGPRDLAIEDAFVALLNGINPPSPVCVGSESFSVSETCHSTNKVKSSKPKKKGDPRIIVECSTVESIVFESQQDPQKVFGRKKNRAKRGAPDDDVWKSVDMEDAPYTSAAAETGRESDISIYEDCDSDHGLEGVTINEVDKDHINFGSGKIRSPQSQADVNGSVGGEKGYAERIEETAEMLRRRKEGQRRAEEREMVRKAARRGCAFGFLLDETGKEKEKQKKGRQGSLETELPKKENRRKCEAVMNGSVVEPSFAKGDWAIRWREDDMGKELGLD